MKRLTLVRHAKSSRDDPDLPDVARPLNERGRKDAAKMGRRLMKRQARPDVLLTSPAVRARQTAKLISEEMGTSPDDWMSVDSLYGGDAGDLLLVIQRLDDRYEHAMVCGHNPEMSDLLRQLGDATEDDLPTCGVAELVFSGSSWARIGRAKAVEVSIDTPKGHEEAG